MKTLFSFIFILTSLLPLMSFAENLEESLFVDFNQSEMNSILEVRDHEDLTSFLSELKFSDLLISELSAESNDFLENIKNNGNYSVTKIDSSKEFYILGKGILNRKTGDVIAIGCLDEKCNQIQNIYFNALTKEASFIGVSIPHPKNADKKELKNIMRSINKNFKKYKREKNKTTRLYVGFFTYALTSFTTNIILGTFSVISPSSIILAIAAQFIFGKNPIFKNSGIISKVFIDQNGWNWRENAREVSDRKFNLYGKFIQSHSEK